MDKIKLANEIVSCHHLVKFQVPLFVTMWLLFMILFLRAVCWSVLVSGRHPRSSKAVHLQENNGEIGELQDVERRVLDHLWAVHRRQQRVDAAES